MIYDRLRVFISSKMAELASERVAIKEELDELNIDAWVFEQDAGARPETIQQSFTGELEASDLYIGVFWKGYGEYTVEEFEHAQKTGKDCLVYQKGGADLAGRDPRLQDFLTRLGRVESGLTVQFFDTPEQLREMIRRDAARWQMRIVRKYRESGPQRATSGLPADPNLVVLRSKVQQFWIDGVLGRTTGLVDRSSEQSSERCFETADADWEAILELPYEGSRVVDRGTSLLSLFDELQSSLLVLGQPGSGKTTTVLQLTRDLIERSVRDGSQPVPVVLNLSAWSPDSPSLSAWIIQELSAKYQIPGLVSRPWLDLGRLVLVLDGLDEVRAAARVACVEAINQFCATNGLAGLVVTCRLDEHDALPVRLRINGAISLQPLGPAQIEAYLESAGAHLEGLRAALRTDETLRELARSPLMLSVMSAAYRGRTAAELEHEAGTPEERRAELLAAYVERAFEADAPARSYSREATTSWLSWLARRMARRNQTVFLIEDLQPSWLARRFEMGAYLVCLAVLFGLLSSGLCILFRIYPSAQDGPNFGTVVWLDRKEVLGWIASCALWVLAIGISDGFRWRAVKPVRATPLDRQRVLVNAVLFWLPWAVLMPAFTAFGGIPDDRIRIAWGMPVALTLGAAALCARRSLSRHICTTESLRLNLSEAGRGVLLSLPIGLVFGAIAYSLPEEADPAAAAGWVLLSAGFGALMRGLQPCVVKGKTVPNQGMQLTIRTSLRAGRFALVLAAMTVLACLIRGGAFADPSLIAKWATTMFVLSSVSLALWFGGLDILKHYLLRGLIGFTRQGPYDFPRLLADASRRNLMQRVGGGYIFAHRLLRDHFAAMDLAPPTRDETRAPEEFEAPHIAAPVLAMLGLALGGLVTLLVGLERGVVTTTVLGGIALGIGALWIVVRTAVASALRAAGADEDS